MNNGHVKIFDTTLRDGEQAPGCSMTLGEKLKISRALTDLNVDIIEAGFPAASPGDFNSVKEIADQNLGPIICGLARCCLLYTSPSPRDATLSRMPSSA